MPTCLSIRFYHHRDTVDSSFVRPEKIGALRSQNTTFIMIYKGCMHLYVCFWSHTEKKRSRIWTDGTKKACVFASVCENLYIRSLLAFCSCVLMFLALRELLQHIEVSGCCVSEKERRSNINTEPLCYQQSPTSEATAASPPLQKWTGSQNTECQAGWMNGWKCQPFRNWEKQLYF